MNPIHYFESNGSTNCQRQETVTAAASWLSTKPEIDALVWTGLSSNWREIIGEAYSIDSLKKYLLSKTNTHSWSYIQEYFLNAPAEVQTPARMLFNEKFK